MNKELFVQNVKKYCGLRGVKPTVACRESGAGPDLINKLISRGSIPSVEKVQLLASYLGVTTSELLGEPAKASPDMGVPSSGDDNLMADPLRSTLLRCFDQLNKEGQERLVETADDMVSSGKYIKSSPAELGNEKYA